MKKNVIESLSRHRDISVAFLDEIKRIPKEILENVGSDIAKKATSMSREVDGDLHEHKAFLRLSVSPHGILYAKLNKMKHYNEIPLLKFFKKRFPTFIILFESNRGVFAADQNPSILTSRLSLEEALKECEGKLPIDPLLIDLNEDNYQNLWENFAQSQIINKRKSSTQVISLSKKWKNTVPIDKSSSRVLDSFFEK